MRKINKFDLKLLHPKQPSQTHFSIITLFITSGYLFDLNELTVAWLRSLDLVDRFRDGFLWPAPWLALGTWSPVSGNMSFMNSVECRLVINNIRFTYQGIYHTTLYTLSQNTCTLTPIETNFPKLNRYHRRSWDVLSVWPSEINRGISVGVLIWYWLAKCQ